MSKQYIVTSLDPRCHGRVGWHVQRWWVPIAEATRFPSVEEAKRYAPPINGLSIEDVNDPSVPKFRKLDGEWK